MLAASSRLSGVEHGAAVEQASQDKDVPHDTRMLMHLNHDGILQTTKESITTFVVLLFCY